MMNRCRCAVWVYCWTVLTILVYLWLFQYIGCSPFDVYTPSLCHGVVCYIHSSVLNTDVIIDTWYNYHVLYRPVHAAWAWSIVTVSFAIAGVRKNTRQNIEFQPLIDDEDDETFEFDSIENIDV